MQIIIILVVEPLESYQIPEKASKCLKLRLLHI